MFRYSTVYNLSHTWSHFTTVVAELKCLLMNVKVDSSLVSLAVITICLFIYFTDLHLPALINALLLSPY